MKPPLAVWTEYLNVSLWMLLFYQTGKLVISTFLQSFDLGTVERKISVQVSLRLRLGVRSAIIARRMASANCFVPSRSIM
jgi:hypothetical protein